MVVRGNCLPRFERTDYIVFARVRQSSGRPSNNKTLQGKWRADEPARCHPRLLRWRNELQRIYELIWIALGLVFSTLIAWWLDLDRALSALIYSPGREWLSDSNGFWGLIYDITPWPALLLGVVALVVLLLGFRYARLRPWRRQALFFILFLALGPGLLVNVVLKDNLHKPRPRDVVEFGWQYRHSEFWQPGAAPQNGNHSFPSGHASIACAVMGPWFFLRQRHKQLAVAFLVSGCIWGVVVGAARMLQGGHFFSDVVWAGGLVYLVGGLLALGFSLDRASPPAKLV